MAYHIFSFSVGLNRELSRSTGHKKVDLCTLVHWQDAVYSVSIERALLIPSL